MAIETLENGTVRVGISRAHFVVSGLVSAAIGAGLSLLARELTEWSLLPWSVATVFGFMSLRRLFQGLVFAKLLEVELDAESISGPCWAWLSRGTARAGEVDWSASIVSDRFVVLYGATGRALGIRMSWFSPSDRDYLRQRIHNLRALSDVATTS